MSIHLSNPARDTLDNPVDSDGNRSTINASSGDGSFSQSDAFSQPSFLRGTVDPRTGSFNYTGAAAQRNAENVLVLHHAPVIAAQYESQWRRLWNEGAALPRTD